MRTVQCRKCGRRWVKRVDRPRQCPNPKCKCKDPLGRNYSVGYLHVVDGAGEVRVYKIKSEA